MSEAMALESLLLRRWELDGYFGRTRVHFGAGVDRCEIDVVALTCAPQLCLRVGEVKSRGTADHLYVLDDRVRRLCAAADGSAEGWLGRWASFVRGFAALYAGSEPALAGLPPWSALEKVELCFVVNAWEAPETRAREQLEAAIMEMLRRIWQYSQSSPHAMSKLSVEVLTTRDLVLDTVDRVVRELAQGRGPRFGDPFLDAVRELYRYVQPSFAYRATRSDGSSMDKSAMSEACAGETRDQLLEALRLL